MLEINWYKLIDIYTNGMFVVEHPDWSTEKMMMKWYADFIAWASNNSPYEESEWESYEESEWKSLEDILAEFEYNIRQEVKKENAELLESITKLINNANKKK